jgi:class 3 adenylate cyclase/tetratricopeptide (TPR) repeat protein
VPEESPETAFERRIVSVLFADLVGFTSLSEQLDPEDVATVQDAYFATVRETVARHGGVLEKFIGDAAMAVFGVPKARDDDAERAIRAGLALVGAVELLGARLGLATGDAGDAGLQLRVGVNSGEVVSAESGPDAGRVTGDTVNLAARFQAAADPGTVMVGELTQLSAADAVEFESIGALELKGKAEPVPAWRVQRLRPERSREEALGNLRAPLLGRADELARLESVLNRVAERREGGSEVIVAPPGVGKSRLLTEFESRAKEAGATVLRARVRADVLGPTEPVGQLLLAALRTLDGASREAVPEALDRALNGAGASPGRAAVVTAEVIETLWPPPVVAGAVPPDRDARFGAWLEALDALAGEQLSAWLIEDIHWAGGDLLAFLALAGTWPARAGRMVVATARPSVLEHLAEGTSVLELPPLPALEASELIRALVGDALPDAVVTAVAERSDGNPLFIEELLRSWISSGTLVADGEGWRLAVAPEAVALPATVQAIYAAQLDDLPAPARLIARRASVAGRRFAGRALEPLDVPEPAEGLERLRQRAFLRGPESDMTGDDIYAYRHALLRDAGYASLSRAERGRLHLALAIWLEQTAGTDVARVAEPIASHYEAALAALPGVGADPDERLRLTDAARSWLERAADAALAVAGHDAAIGLLGRAADLAAGDDREAARLRLRRGELMASSGNMSAGVDEIQAALESFRTAYRADSSDMVARAGYGNAAAAMGDAMIEQIRAIEARDLVAETLAEIGQPEDALVGRLLALHAWAKVFQGDRETTVAEVERALELVRGGDPRVEIQVRGWRASVRTEAQISVVEEWRELEVMARAQGMWAVAVRALLMRFGNDPAASARDTLAAVRSGFDLATNHGLTEVASGSSSLIVGTQLGLGEWDEALALGFENVALAERNAYSRVLFRIWMALAPMLEARGDRDQLARYATWFDTVRSMFPEPPSPYAQVHNAAIDRMMATVGLPPVNGRPMTVEILATEAYNNVEYVAALEITIRDWLAEGASDRAAEALERIELSYRDDDDFPPTLLIEASFALMHAWVLRAHGSGAVEAARTSADWSRRAEAPWWLARAIRALPDGEATAEELAEAAEIEGRLRVREGASAPPV